MMKDTETIHDWDGFRSRIQPSLILFWTPWAPTARIMVTVKRSYVSIESQGEKLFE